MLGFGFAVGTDADEDRTEGNGSAGPFDVVTAGDGEVLRTRTTGGAFSGGGPVDGAFAGGAEGAGAAVILAEGRTAEPPANGVGSAWSGAV